MTDIVDAEVVEEEPTTDLAVYRPQMVLSPADAAVLVAQVAEAKRSAMVAEVDYGHIPGTPKPSLLKPGAEKLLLMFGLGFDLVRQEVDHDAEGRPYGVTYRCVVTKSMADREVVVAAAEAYGGRDEKKWSNPDKTPWHTILAMTQKRALVAAALRATASSGLFTSDMEDHAQPVSFGSIVQEHILALGEPKTPRRDALAEWWKSRELPRVVDLNAAQAAEVLVRVGQLSGEEVPQTHRPDPERIASEPHGATRLDDAGEGDGLQTDPPPERRSAPSTEEAAFLRRQKAANASLTEVGIRGDDERHAAIKEATGGQTESTRALTSEQLTHIRAWCSQRKVAARHATARERYDSE